jgi:hypothetical protein
MHNRLWFHVFLVSAMLFSLPASSYGADPESSPPTGTFSDTLKSAKGEAIMKYKACVPKTLPETKTLGLIVAFHGRSGNENSMINPTTRPLKKLGILDQYVVLCGKSRGIGWRKVDHDATMKLIQWAMKTYPIDPRRIHLYGFSSGAFMATAFGWPHQKYFATVTAYCGASSTRWGGKKPPSRRKDALAETRTEFYFVHGDSDPVVPVKATRSLCKELRAAGYRYIYRELDGHNHGSIFGEKDIYTDVFQWVHATRNKSYPLSKEERKTLAKMPKMIATAKGPEAQALIDEVARIGGPAAGKVLLVAFRSSDAEMRLAAVKSAVTTSYGAAVIRELGRLMTTDKDPAIRIAAIEALGSAARWRQRKAQVILAKEAPRPTTSEEDKLAIVAELGKCFDLMVLGNMEDSLIPVTLVKLLSDPKPSVRAAAFEHLKKAVPDGLSYSPDGDAAARKASVGRWEAWANKATLKPLDGGYKYTKPR